MVPVNAHSMLIRGDVFDVHAAVHPQRDTEAVNSSFDNNNANGLGDLTNSGAAIGSYSQHASTTRIVNRHQRRRLDLL